MNLTVSLAPVILVDILGSIAMIVLSFFCVGLARKLKRGEPDNVVWTYLQWLCWGLAVFAVSRSAGHLVKQILVLSGHQDLWRAIQPGSGAINSFMFILVASVTLFFERVQQINQQVIADREALRESKEELLYLNQNLEELVGERTRALSASEHQYRRIFEVSRDMILLTDMDGRILECNPACSNALGVGAQEQQRESVQEFFAAPEKWEELRQSLLHNGFVQNAETVLQKRGGATRRALVSASLDSEGNQEEERLIHFLIRDVEEKKLMEARMVQTDKLASIGELSSGIAHEINNPLGIILGYTQLLLRGEEPDTEKHQDLKTIEKHVQSCKAILEDLLHFARGGEPAMEPAEPNSLIDETLQFLRITPGLQNIALEKVYGADLPPVEVDRKKFGQVMMNLVMNATHAMDGKGSIFVSTSHDKQRNRVEIKVRDTGRGIEQENLKRIFDPFFTTKPTGQGTGLGLSVSYGIIQNHGGDIRVQSQPGQGTTFCVTLPARPDLNRPAGGE